MKNQKGFMPILIGFIVVAVVGIVGYLLIAKNKAPGKGVLSNIQLPGGVGLNANCKLNDPELCRYMDKSVKMADSFKTGFTGTSVTTDKAGKKSESMWEMTGDKSHFTSSENGKELSNMIVIGDTTYTKDLSDGKWTKFTFKSSAGSGSKGLFNADEIKNQFKDAVNETVNNITYTSLGKEACGSMQCFKYQINNPATSSTKEYVYFDDKEYVMRKMRVETAESVTETMFDFKNVTINEPSPVKESPANSMGVGSTSSIDTSKIQEEIQKYMNQSSSSSSESSTSQGE